MTDPSNVMQLVGPEAVGHIMRACRDDEGYAERYADPPVGEPDHGQGDGADPLALSVDRVTAALNAQSAELERLAEHVAALTALVSSILRHPRIARALK